MNTIFEYPLLIREFHLDTFGHVNNAVYLQIFEEARWQFITEHGYGLKEIREALKGPVILEINLHFKHEMKLRDQVTIHSQMEKYEGKVGLIKQWITNQKGDICCEATFKMAFFDLKTRKIILPTPEWLKAVGLAT